MDAATIWLYWAGLMFLLGLWRGLPHVAAAAALLGACVGLAKAYSQRVWDHLTCDLASTVEATYPDTAVELRCVIRNAKWLPLWGLSVDLYLPKQSYLQGEKLSVNAADGHSITFALGVNWQEKATKRLSVAFSRRGVYQLGQLRLQCADPLGLYPRTHHLERSSQVAVFPVPYPDLELRHTCLAWLGDQVRRKRFLDDPVYLAGLRDYRPGDPVKRIDWKATARTGQAQLREFDESVQLETVVIVDSRTDRYIWHGYDEAKVESVISIAAAVVDQLFSSGTQVSLHANAYLVHNVPRTLRAGSGPDHWRSALHHLAAILPSGSVEMAGVLSSLYLQDRATISVVLITAYLDAATGLWLEQHPELQQRLLLILVGDHHEISSPEGCPTLQLPVWKEAAHG